MQKYVCVLILLSLFFVIPLFAQSRREATRSDVKRIENLHEPPVASLNTFEQMLIKFEHRFWEAMKRKDIESVIALVAEDAQFVDENNIVSKSEFTRHISNYTPSDYSLTGIKVKAITAKVGIVSYKVEAKYKFNSTQLPVTTALVTSVWVNQGSKWRLKHQHAGLMPVTKADP